MGKEKTVKNNGQVFTPDYIVNYMLDVNGYRGPYVVGKHVIDNSCGDGAFLREIVKRYCDGYIQKHHSSWGLEKDLETYIHGIELDEEVYWSCMENLDEAVLGFGGINVSWDIKNADALTVTEYDGKMDFVFGNPPYVRVHNLNDSYADVKRFSFAQNGMTDLYLAFYELGINMLSERGILCYISPSSWLTSVAGEPMRNYFKAHKHFTEFYDLGHYQPFDNATTYTGIVVYSNIGEYDNILYYKYDENCHEFKFVSRISEDDYSINGKFYFAKWDDLRNLRKILNEERTDLAVVKNGFATLADKVFIGSLPFTEMTIPILKGSTGKWSTGFYPYDEEGKPVGKEEIFSNDKISEYLRQNKELLLKGKTEDDFPDWYLYGRTQALKDVYKDKIGINTIIKDKESIKLEPVPAGSGIYSGLYILTEAPFEMVKEVIVSDDFIEYVSSLKNYKSGGYYTFSSKDLSSYLNFKLKK